MTVGVLIDRVLSICSFEVLTFVPYLVAMDEAVRVGDWVHSYSMGIWRVWRLLSGYNELRFSLDTPKTVSAHTLVFSSRLVNTSWKRSFSTECAALSFVRRISPDVESRIHELLQSNPALGKAFEKYQAKNNSLDLVVNVSLGQLPGSDRAQFRAACSKLLGHSVDNGIIMDEVLAALRDAGYYHCIGKTPIAATVQLISVGHEVRDREFILRYNRVLDF
jgi:hypothetical protein